MGNSQSKKKHPRSDQQVHRRERPRSPRPPSYESGANVPQTGNQHEMNEARGNSATQNNIPSNSRLIQHEAYSSIHPGADEQLANPLQITRYHSESHGSHGFHKSHRHLERHHRRRRQHDDDHQSRRHHRTHAFSPSGSRRGDPGNTSNSYHAQLHSHSHFHFHSHPPQSQSQPQPQPRRPHDEQCSRSSDRSKARDERGSKASSRQHNDGEANWENLFVTKNHRHGTRSHISNNVAIEYIPPGRRAKQLLKFPAVPASPSSSGDGQKHSSHDKTFSPRRSRGRTRTRSPSPD